MDWAPVSTPPPQDAHSAPFQPSAPPLDPHYHLAPRFIHAVDDAARESLTRIYAEEFVRAAAVAAQDGFDEPSAIDVAASWCTNWPTTPLLLRSFGVGLCAGELERAGFDDWLVADLCAEDVALPGGAFHIATLASGAQYFRDPVRAFGAVRRSLVGGGILVVSFSSSRIVMAERVCAPWLKWGSMQRVAAVAAWMAEAGFSDVEWFDASPLKGSPITDDLFILRAKNV